MPSLHILGVGLAIAISSLSGANAAAITKSTLSDQVPVTHPDNLSSGSDDAPVCNYLAEAAFDFPCGKITDAGAVRQYKIVEGVTASLGDCALACFNNGKCASLSYQDGLCVLYSEEALYMKDARESGSGPLYDSRCFRCV
ncbi:hypothetical protein BGZ61DRAFT_436879 [Ilyonectria robusta]|uniref:uncharacterized protein n=1 Tax=Ilyonectria robusta TaxID=1079257 RepID=UPI001E8D8937|nr:uncharacterized protein BGZ61DRAFT_436879 [Ilyonectria robusta]KAH8736714.1 hypothetical protein BGZ61DRAFT_436879 [Ilyonectria robusta]